MHARTSSALALAVSLALPLSACTAPDESTDLIRIGTTQSTLPEWQAFQQGAQEEGYEVELVPYGDYSTANEALDRGRIDLNHFQHLNYLASHNVRNETDLVPIASSAYYPIGLYWQDRHSLSGVSEVYVPQGHNHHRALKLLHENGLNPARLRIREATTSDLLKAYEKGHAAIIPTEAFQQADTPPTEALVVDSPEPSWTYVWVTTPEKASDPRLLNLAELWHDPEVFAIAEKTAGGMVIPQQHTQEQLATDLRAIEQHLGG